MSTGTKTAPAKVRPVTVTFTGDLALKIRETSKLFGMRASGVAEFFASQGEALSSPTDKGREFRLGMAAQYMGMSLEEAESRHRWAKERTARYCAELRAKEAKAKKAAAGKEVAR